MNWIDVSVLAVVLLSVLIGVMRGFIKEALSLLNWGLAVTGSIYFHDISESYLSKFIDSLPVRSVVAYGVVFLVILVTGSIISHLISFIVKKSGLGGTDRMLGILFGFIRGVLVCSICLIVVSFTPIKKQVIWQHSQALPYFEPLMNWINDAVPEQVNIAKDHLQKVPAKVKEQSLGAVANLAMMQEMTQLRKS